MLTVTVTPSSVRHGKPVTIKVVAKHDLNVQQPLFLTTRVYRWTKRFWWVYFWQEKQKWVNVKLPPHQEVTKEYGYTPSTAARYKAEAGLYDAAGRQRETAAAEFKAT